MWIKGFGHVSSLKYSVLFEILVTKFWNFLIKLTGLAIKDHKEGLNDYKWAKKSFGDHKKSLIEHNLTNTDLFLVDRGYLDRGSTVVTKPCQQWLIHIYFHATSDFDYRFNPPLGWAIFNPCSYEFGGRKLVNKWGNIYWIRIRGTCSIHLTSFLTLNRLFCGFSDSIYSTKSVLHLYRHLCTGMSRMTV